MNLKKSKFISRFIWSIVVIIGIILLIWSLMPRPVLVEVAKVKQDTYEQIITVEGKTRVKDSYTIKSLVTGNLRRVDLEVGDKVKKGQVLAIVDEVKPREMVSPIDGIILKVYRESSGPITRGDDIFEVANPETDDLEVYAEVLTQDAVTIRPGQDVVIDDWGGCADMHGKVRRVDPAAFTKVSALGIEEQRVNVIIDITSYGDDCHNLGEAFFVECHIKTFRQDNVIVVPTGALFRKDRDWAAFVVKDGSAKLSVIDVIRYNQEQAMVKTGVVAGDLVILFPSDEIADGVGVTY